MWSALHVYTLCLKEEKKEEKERKGEGEKQSDRDFLIMRGRRGGKGKEKEVGIGWVIVRPLCEHDFTSHPPKKREKREGRGGKRKNGDRQYRLHLSSQQHQLISINIYIEKRKEEKGNGRSPEWWGVSGEVVGRHNFLPLTHEREKKGREKGLAYHSSSMSPLSEEGKRKKEKRRRETRARGKRGRIYL